MARHQVGGTNKSEITMSVTSGCHVILHSGTPVCLFQAQARSWARASGGWQYYRIATNITSECSVGIEL